MKVFNYELLLRPIVGISEFSETVLENAKYIKENLQIFDVGAIERFLSKPPWLTDWRHLTEFLLRPSVGISEFSETVLENAKYIKENLQIFDVEAIERFLNETDGIVESLQTVNKKDTSASGKGIFLYYNLSFVT